MSEREEERESGQHPPIHDSVEPVAHPRTEDTNEYADERVEVVEPDGSPSPTPE